MNEIKNKGTNVIYLNFEDEKIISNVYDDKQYCTELKINYSIMDYLIWGGFPKRFELKVKKIKLNT